MAYELSEHARRTALAAVRAMFPHDGLPDEVYMGVVDQVEAAAGDPGVAAGIEQGVAQLDDPQASGGTDPVQVVAGGHSAVGESTTQAATPPPARRFADLDPAAQLAALERSQASPFFQLLKATAVVALYDNPVVWKAFGYEGPSVHLGGYLHRGFDDLDWLPDPPISLDPTAGSHHL
jgi:hypothetical protein